MGFDINEWSMRVYLRFVTWRSGEMVGADGEGNRYYRAKKPGPHGRERRWVVFNGGPSEASRVPPDWHAWLHHTFKDAPAGESPYRQPWQKPHEPNRTGTSGAYLPSGHVLSGGRRARATGDYEAWTPD